MNINRDVHPVLTEDDLKKFISQLKPLEVERLIDCLEQRVISIGDVTKANKKIVSIEKNIEDARELSHKAYHGAMNKSYDESRNHALDSYFKTGEVLDEITALKEQMKSFEG